MNVRTKPISLLYSMDHKTLQNPQERAGWKNLHRWPGEQQGNVPVRRTELCRRPPSGQCHILSACSSLPQSRAIQGLFWGDSEIHAASNLSQGECSEVLIGCANHHFFLFCRSGCARRVSSVSGGSSIVQCRLHRFAARSGSGTGTWRHAELSRAHNVQTRYTGEHTKPDLASS